MALILIVDDEPDMRELIREDVTEAGHQVLEAGSTQAALDLLQDHAPDLIVSDVVMPGATGFELCAAVRNNPELGLTPFLFVTGRSGMEDKFRGLFVGADDYITKPFESDDLLARIEGRLQHRATVLSLQGDMKSAQSSLGSCDDAQVLRRERAAVQTADQALYDAGYWHLPPPGQSLDEVTQRVERLEKRYPKLAEFRARRLVGQAPAFLQIFEDILIASTHDDATLILGETGTGKTGVAEAIWYLGKHSDGPFLTLNCAELAAADPTIVLGKLFGYGRNSGLNNIPAQGQPGLLEEANGGVLFLDEFSQLPPQAQTMLLLPLEGRPFHPAVGTGDPRTVSVKFILATNRDLAREVEDDEFPRDVYERIANDSIFIPPLRSRQSDIPALTQRFLTELEAEESIRASIDATALTALSDYPWPGNVRELRRVIRRAARKAALRAEEVTVLTEDLPSDIVAAQSTESPAPRVTETSEPIAEASETPAAPTRVFNPRETSELTALRETGFNVGKAECLLGYSSRSRTLSHRLRGMCLKGLAITEGHVEHAAGLLTGEHTQLKSLLVRRLQQLIDRLTSQLEAGKTPGFKHLQTEHRPYADDVLKLLDNKTN